ncbi:Transcriptional regulator [Labilithrix luteola]|uniref:Transcriptional regulator n=1 Tax=Labilithrix luteola TaxID=1391654 RepID=A0A0K1Q439_9BACT|nr:Transcriptional regulator [Labilithrix luteola]
MAMHRAAVLAVLAMDGVVPFDLATPGEVFGRARIGRDPARARAAYDVRICAPKRRAETGLFELRAPYDLDELGRADTIVVPGVADVSKPVPRAVLEALQKASARGARIASICSGAFILAAAGLLDGRRATTHWLAASELARRYPAIHVDPHVLYVDEGNVLTSAGAAAGLDLCLHIVRTDHGASVAAAVAKLAVMPLERAGGQSQFIVHEPPSAEEGASLEPVLRWLAENLQEKVSLDDIARRAGMSLRTLSRRFREQTGTTPLGWLLRARVRHAQQLLETTPSSIERIATSAGFGSATTFRLRFQRVVGTSPRAYRNAFRGAVPEHDVRARRSA